MTQRDIAGYLNIDRTTLYNWKKNKPNLYKTIILGLKSKEIIEAVGYSDIEKRNLLTEIGEKFNLELKKILTPEQIEKYEKLISKKKK